MFEMTGITVPGSGYWYGRFLL